MSYCASRYQTFRRRTIEVKAGAVGMGGDNPVRVQSMTTSDTQDVAATVRQCIALAEAGCEIIRVTAPNIDAAKCLRDIRAQFSAAAAGFANIPLVADIHFLPAAAMEAVEHVEKVRINPGNYAGKKRFAAKDYTDADYAGELQRIHDAFTPLVLRAKALGRALRIGVNHGSLSDRIMNRHGDTPPGMVESALEFLRIARGHSFDQIVLSMKSSNPKVMIQAYRLLVERMDAEDMRYPLHLGVTEAGDGEDGRIKGAIGIGSLLQDGLGDTIRVSLTEDSVNEIPVARALADRAAWGSARVPRAGLGVPPKPKNLLSGETPDKARETRALPEPMIPASCDSIDPFHYTRRDIAPLTLAPGVDSSEATGLTISAEQPPRVITRAPSVAALAETLAQLSTPALADTPAEAVLVPIDAAADLDALPLDSNKALVLDLAPGIAASEIFARAPHGKCEGGGQTTRQRLGAPASSRLTTHRAAQISKPAKPAGKMPAPSGTGFQPVSSRSMGFQPMFRHGLEARATAGKMPALPVAAASSTTPTHATAPTHADTTATLNCTPPHTLLRVFTANDAAALRDFVALAASNNATLALATTAADLAALAPTLTTLPRIPRLIFTLAPQPQSATHPTGAYRQLAEALRALAPSPLARAPIWIRVVETSAGRAVSPKSPPQNGGFGETALPFNSARQRAIQNPKSKIQNLLDASILTGSLLCDGIGDIVSIETENDPVRATQLAYNILQGAGARISKTEFVACPSCGRTLFDLQAATQRIRAKTGHLKGVKLAIMGCIVNGPGEMADADFGYVGGAPGKINLYAGKTCVRYNIPQAEADDRLIDLIKQHGKWTDPA